MEEPDADDAYGWEAVGRNAMLRDGEYDYACVCLNRALELRIAECGGREAADGDPSMAGAWYMHGSALLRRAQAMAMRAGGDGAAAASDGASDGAPTTAAAATADAARAALGAGGSRVAPRPSTPRPPLLCPPRCV